MNERLKKIIYNKMFEDLKDVEIIPYKDSIWFVNREKESWYLQYKKTGRLWWRWNFFENFFQLFSLQQEDYEPIISSWVEDVLNCRVETTLGWPLFHPSWVEDVLNCRVETTKGIALLMYTEVEDVLNYRVETTKYSVGFSETKVEDVLNCKVETTNLLFTNRNVQVKDVLNCRVEDILNQNK